ncbi:MAG TPA: DUF1349 domain-containing protein [Chloroflexia bacterium]|nr:DUF1349 domain-containing protein [Chloroflexia bacterium]
MHGFNLPLIPGTLQWRNDPVDTQVEDEKILIITAGETTDWFIDPDGTFARDNTPSALFIPPDDYFLLSAKVGVNFGSTYDAGVLQIFIRPDLGAKLCFEYSPQQQPMVVSVVTRGVSDDCNSVLIDGQEVYLRIFKKGTAFAFHYSLDGKYWHFVRYFSLGEFDSQDLRVGFLAQSPTGQKCTASFSEISYRQGSLKDLRNGE